MILEVDFLSYFLEKANVLNLVRQGRQDRLVASLVTKLVLGIL